MTFTFAEKVLARASGTFHIKAGDIVDVRPDRILSHDNTAAIARIFYDELGAQRVANPEQLCITLDHAAPPPTPRHAQNHTEVRAFVKRQGVRNFFEVGRGICHQVLSEEALILPGQIILGADSHTPHFGWLGAFGAGVGRSEMAAVWATERLWLRVPESICITLTDFLRPGVTTKDLCLTLIGELGADGGLYKSVEFAGPGLHTLSLESRMVIPNMMAEFGVKNAYLPPDEAVFEYLSRRGQPSASTQALYPDPDASYIAEYTLDLSNLEPVIACPHMVDKVRPLSQVAGQRVDMAFIGTCTNGRYEDLAATAEVLQGHHVHPNTRLLVVPASSQAIQQALQSGVLATLIEAGAIIGTPGCGPCMGNHMGVPGPGEVVISSANRNFRGRMGQPKAEIYLASPAVVAASAVQGQIAHPAEVIGDWRFDIRDWGTSRHVPALYPRSTTKRQTTSSHSQPTLQHPQSTIHNPSTSLRTSPKSKVWKYGDNINTDLIFPGKYTYTLRTPTEIAAHALEDLDASFASHVRSGDVIFGGRNWGCGSSREQAVSCLKYKQVAAVVAESFARIFYRNAINRGLPAIVCPEAVAAARMGDWVAIDLEDGLIHLPAGTFSFAPFPPNVHAILDAGGLIPYLNTRS